jgi:hypothetical protein
MIFRRSDRLYEEAAQNPAQFDRLLRQARWMRAFFFVLAGVVWIALLVWAVWLTSRIGPPLAAAVAQNSAGPLIEASPKIPDLRPFKYCIGVIIMLAVSNVAGMLFADSTVKMLILIRATQRRSDKETEA